MTASEALFRHKARETDKRVLSLIDDILSEDRELERMWKRNIIEQDKHLKAQKKLATLEDRAAERQKQTNEVRWMVKSLRNTVETVYARSAAQRRTLNRTSRRQMRRLIATSTGLQGRKLEELLLQTLQLRHETARQRRFTMEARAQQRLTHEATMMSVRFGIEERLGSLCSGPLDFDSYPMAKLVLEHALQAFGSEHALVSTSRSTVLSILLNRAHVRGFPGLRFSWHPRQQAQLDDCERSLPKLGGPHKIVWHTAVRVETPSESYLARQGFTAGDIACLIAGLGTSDLFALLDMESFVDTPMRVVGSGLSTHDCTPLEMACSQQQSRMVKYLQTRGRDINQPNWRGRTLLHESVAGGDRDQVRFALEHRARVNCWAGSPSNAEAPVGAALVRGDVETLQLLLEADALIEWKFAYPRESSKNTGSTFNFLDLALGDGYPAFIPNKDHLECARLLKEKGLQPSRPGSWWREMRATWTPRLDGRPKFHANAENGHVWIEKKPKPSFGDYLFWRALPRSLPALGVAYVSGAFALSPPVAMGLVTACLFSGVLQDTGKRTLRLTS